ncbi:MAG: hypothetical protein Q8Q17_02465 [bacterium]|nr:hypothetical protein [bacterium]
MLDYKINLKSDLEKLKEIIKRDVFITKDRAKGSGAEDFMVKAHFTPCEIVAKIKSILQKKCF